MLRTALCLALFILLGRASSSQEEKSQSTIAEDTFRTIEKRILASKALKIEFTSEITTSLMVDGTRSRTTNSGLILVGEGNKVAFSGRIVRSEGIVQNRLDYSYLSDGKLSEEWVRPGSKRAKEVTPADLDSHLRKLALLLSPSDVLDYLERRAKQEKSIEERLPAYEFGVLPDSGNRRGISYKLKGIDGKVLRVTLWYEADTYRLLNRLSELMYSEGIVERTAKDTYESFQLDVVLPEGTFKLADE